MPFAGGSSRSFAKWSNLLVPNIEIIDIELAGRGKRFQEECYKSVKEAIDNIYQILHPVFTGSEPYAIFGHSMGGLLAFELCYKIQELNHIPPIAAFFSAKSAPHLAGKKKVHLFEKKRFIQHLFELGGTPKQLLNNEEFLDLYLPYIRSDYKMIETYQFEKRSSLLNIPFHILYGDRDEIKMNQLTGWKEYTNMTCQLYEFFGGHFFIQSQEKEVVSLIESILTGKLTSKI
nr:thioesterase domain-containing protein [Priestia koreensis]